VLEALEQHVVLLRLIGHLGSDQDAIAVRIGSEHEYEGLRSTSVVTAGYGPGAELLGGIGVLGPTRMDYPATMAAVRTVARYVSEILAP
jgi:heat-inducible transcriptional repressor